MKKCMKKCENCNRQIGKNWSTCPYCFWETPMIFTGMDNEGDYYVNPDTGERIYS